MNSDEALRLSGKLPDIHIQRLILHIQFRERHQHVVDYQDLGRPREHLHRLEERFDISLAQGG